MILGASVDAQFGPLILFGQGGTAAEIIADRALALPPLNFALARELIGETRIARELRGYRDRPPAAMDEIALTLVKLSQLMCDLDEVVELDLNPLLADSNGVIAVDARIRVQEPHGNRGARRRSGLIPGNCSAKSRCHTADRWCFGLSVPMMLRP